jgi:hypothetical protein
LLTTARGALRRAGRRDVEDTAVGRVAAMVGLAPGGTNRPRRHPPLLVDVDHAHHRALAREVPGDPLAEPAPGARDQDRLAVKPTHYSIPNSLAV